MPHPLWQCVFEKYPSYRTIYRDKFRRWPLLQKVICFSFQIIPPQCRREGLTLRIYSIMSLSLYNFSLRLVLNCWGKHRPQPCDSWEIFKERRGRHNMVQDPSRRQKGKNCALQSIQSLVRVNQLRKILPGIFNKAEDRWIVSHPDECYT